MGSTDTQRCEPPGEEVVGIACSGGGIRSAAFNLGALQALTTAGILGRARWLAAVSGGSYIASAFATVARYSDAALLREAPPFAPGTPEERHVRNRCSYLAADTGGVLRLLAAVVVGFAANVAFVLALLFALRPLGWGLAAWQGSAVADGDLAPGRLVLPVAVVVALAAASLVVAVPARVLNPTWRWRVRWDRLAAGLALAAAAVGVVGVAVPWLVVWVRATVASSVDIDEAAVGQGLRVAAGAGVASTAALSAAQLTASLRRTFDLARPVVAAAGRVGRLGGRARRALVVVVGGLVGPLGVLAAFVLVVGDAAAAGDPPDGREWATWLGGLVAFLVFLRFADVTSWSLHPFYKRRLASAFAVGRQRGDNGEPVAREVDYGEVLRMSGFAREHLRTPFPELVVCAAANVSDRAATPPGSGVAPFAFSPSRIGGPLVGEVPAAAYERAVGRRRRMDVTLPAAVAMSGAAVSPAMGKMTRASLRFAMALANVRLGVWMPNPSHLPRGAGAGVGAGDSVRARAVRAAAPANPRPLRLLFEAVGRHRLRSPYLYVTDGGHHENLGLVELLRCRPHCTTIFCFDASGDAHGSCTTLGEAVALARTELGVEIAIDPSPLCTPDGDRYASDDVVVGTFRHPDGCTGTIHFAKACLTRGDGVPWDVHAYGAKDAEFPLHSTVDQRYTGERFEAYRALGAAVGAHAVASSARSGAGASAPGVVELAPGRVADGAGAPASGELVR